MCFIIHSAMVLYSFVNALILFWCLGAFNITREAQRRSQEAQMTVDGTNRYIQESQNVRERVEKMLEDNMDDFNKTLQNNQNALKELDMDVMELSGKITEINTMVMHFHWVFYNDCGKFCQS